MPNKTKKPKANKYWWEVEKCNGSSWCHHGWFPKSKARTAIQEAEKLVAEGWWSVRVTYNEKTTELNTDD